MGKLKIKNKNGGSQGEGVPRTAGSVRVPKKKVVSGTLHIDATFNNTKALISDKEGNTLFWSSAGALGFKGAKKGTPFAAAKIGEVLSEKAETLGLKEVDVIVKGVGAGRESAIRSFVAKGVQISSIKDVTPVPFNGPKRRKPRRV
jgi:small subunit ribosomal protein S11